MAVERGPDSSPNSRPTSGAPDGSDVRPAASSRARQRAAPPDGSHAPDPRQLLSIAVDLARMGGKRAVEMRQEAISQVSAKSTPTDVVTAADQATERLILDGLRTRRPDDEVLGEETGTHNSAVRPAVGHVRWLLDPIDGTVNYLYGIPYYGVSLAAEIDGQVVVGVVRNPVSGEEWTAVRGGGAYRQGQRLAGSSVTELSQTLVATGFGYHPDRRAQQARVVAALLRDVRDIRRFGAAALDLCHVAEGRVDAFFEKGLAPWDLAAGSLIAEEAGLLVTGLRGEPPGALMTLAAPRGVRQQLHDRLVAVGADVGP